MLSREPPYQPDGYLHGERNTPKMRFKDPRNAHRNDGVGKVVKKFRSRRRCWMQVYTNFLRMAKSAKKSRNSARRSSRSAASSTVARK